MWRKGMVVVLMLLALSTPTVASEQREGIYFEITAATEINKDVEEAYVYKNNVIDIFQELAKGIDKDNYYKVIIDNLNLFKSENVVVEYEHPNLIIIMGEGEGTTITGELRVDYCVKEITRTKFFIHEIFR